MNSSSLTRFFKLELEKIGYCGLTPSWSLSYCQGDGIAFYGEALAPSALVARLMPELSTEDQSALAGSVYLKVTPNSRSYSHAYTMNVDVYPDDDGEDLRVGTLVDRVLEDVRFQSKRLEELGYRILEATSGQSVGRHEPQARIYRRGEFIVTSKMLPAENLDLYESGEGKHDHRDALRMAAGELIAYDVCVTVRWRTRVLAEARTYGVVDRIGPDAPSLSFSSIALKLVRECRAEIDSLRAAL